MMHADSASMATFLTERMAPNENEKRPVAERVSQALSRRGRLRDLVPVAFEAKSATVLEVRCRTGDGDPATLTFEVEAAAPWRIVSVRMIVGG